MFNDNMYKKYLTTENINEDITEEWYFMSPLTVSVIIVSYLVFVLKIGPGFMRSRPPFDLKIILVVYNILQVYISIMLFYLTTYHVWQNGLIHRQQCEMQSKEFKMQTAKVMYYYYLSKITELLDTIFFVLRKKHRQVSFLHVYHHSFSVVFTWCVCKFEPTAYNFILVGSLNSFVHIIMYSYYGLSAFPSLSKYLWWKKYITKIQLVQFFLIVLHLTVSNSLSPCNSSNLLVIILVLNNLLFIYLFANFYIKEYLKRGLTEKSVIAPSFNNINNHYKTDNTKLF